MYAPWLVDSEHAAAHVHLTEPLDPGTVISRQPGALTTYMRHDPNGLEPARGAVARRSPDGTAFALLRAATLLGPMLNGGAGIDYRTRCDLRMCGFRVVP